MQDGNGPYDIFFSLSGTDRGEVEPIIKALEKRRLKVFYDRTSIGVSDEISPVIIDAVRNCRVLVAFFSEAYTWRSACQAELRLAILATERRGTAGGRILIINPEDHEEHLEPSLIADLKFDRYVTGPGAAEAIAKRIAGQIAPIKGPLDPATPQEAPRWFGGRAVGSARFTGRYLEQWKLHDPLVASRYQLTRNAQHGPAVVLSGPPGSGRTSLAAAYAFQYGAAHGGGVHWLRLAGSTAADVADRYAGQLAAIATDLRLDTAGFSPRELSATIANHLYVQHVPSLWIVDDIPHGIDPQAMHEMLLPGGDRIRTILITDAAAYTATDLPVTALAGMSTTDAASLLNGYRPAEDPAEAAGQASVIESLDGNPLALTQVGIYLRDRPGIRGYADIAADLHQHAEVFTVLHEKIRATAARLSPATLWILAAYQVCGRGFQPAGFLLETMRLLTASHGLSAAQAENALTDMGTHMLAARVDKSWKVSALVLDAMSGHLPAAAMQDHLAALAAEAAAAFVAADGRERRQIIEIAAALVDRPITKPLRLPLWRMLATDADERGDAAKAVHWWRQVLGVSGDPADLRSGSAAHLDAGEYAEALRLASLAVATDPAGVEAPRATIIQAKATVALGRFDDADRFFGTLISWQGLTAVDELHAAVAQAESHVVRGDFSAAGHIISRALQTGHAQAGQNNVSIADQLCGLRLQQARIWLATNRQDSARSEAAAVVKFYQDRETPQHHTAVNARMLLAEAQLTPKFTELHPDRRNWARAASDLQALRDEQLIRYGPASPLSIAALANYAQALVMTGEAGAARAELQEVARRAETVLSKGHPLYLRVAFLLGQAFGQLGLYPESRAWAEIAYTGQRDLLGPLHPDTLASQFQLGVQLKLLGEPGARNHFLHVRKHASASVGPATDLNGMAVTASVLVWAPGWLWRTIDRQQHKAKRT